MRSSSWTNDCTQQISNSTVDSIHISVISNGERDLLANPEVGISRPNELTDGQSIASVDECSMSNLTGISLVVSIYGNE